MSSRRSGRRICGVDLHDGRLTATAGMQSFELFADGSRWLSDSGVDGSAERLKIAVDISLLTAESSSRCISVEEAPNLIPNLPFFVKDCSAVPGRFSLMQSKRVI